MWETENTGGRPTPFAYVYLPSGTKGEQPGALQDKERCGQNLWQGAFPTLQVRRPAGRPPSRLLLEVPREGCSAGRGACCAAPCFAALQPAPPSTLQSITYPSTNYLQTEKWYDVKLGLRLNTPGQVRKGATAPQRQRAGRPQATCRPQ